MIDLIVVDSVAAIVPESEIQGNFSEQTIGLQARIMSKGLRIIQGLLAKYNTTIIFINQLREKVGVFYGSNEITTGGRALKFYSSIRIELKRAELIKNGSECIGIRSVAKVVKNKLAAPLSKAYIDFYFDQGINHNDEIIQYALDYDIIQKKGSWYYYNGEHLGQGKEATIEYLLANPTIFEDIKNKCLDRKDTSIIETEEKIKEDLKTAA